jgi:hypothetical protein
MYQTSYVKALEHQYCNLALICAGYYAYNNYLTRKIMSCAQFESLSIGNYSKIVRATQRNKVSTTVLSTDGVVSKRLSDTDNFVLLLSLLIFKRRKNRADGISLDVCR